MLARGISRSGVLRRGAQFIGSRRRSLVGNLLSACGPNYSTASAQSTGTLHSAAFAKHGSNLSVSPRDESIGIDAEVADMNWQHMVKRKFALVCGYVGSNYNGLQHDPSSNRRFIETELRDALLRVGAIRPSNAANMKKVRWSRSSRTDKGVHASRIVIAANLEVKPQWLHGVNAVANESSVDEIEPMTQELKDTSDRNSAEYIRLPQLVEKLNAVLPSDIRVFSCVKVNKGFDARTGCTWREYEYVMPVDILTKEVHYSEEHPQPAGVSNSTAPPQDLNEALQTLDQVLRSMEGSHFFHNFNRINRKDVLRDENARRSDHRNKHDSQETTPLCFDSTNVSMECNDKHPEIFDQTRSIDSEMDVDDVNNDTERVRRRGFNIHWTPTEKLKLKQMKCAVYCCRISDVLPTDADDAPQMVAIRVRGSGFLLHQIRIMVGTAVAIARGVLPPFAVELALEAPYHFNFPLAPAQGLSLDNAGFDRNSKPIAMSTATKGDNSSDYLLLMNDDEYEQSAQFYKSAVRARIEEDWRNTSDEGELTRWVRFCERFRPSEEVLEQWSALYDDFCGSNAITPPASLGDVERTSLDEAQVYDYRRIELTLERFRIRERDYKQNQRIKAERHRQRQQQHQLRIGHMEDAVFPATPTTDDAQRDANPRAPRTKLVPVSTVRHRDFLPRTFATQMVICFNTVPGKRIDEAQRAIATSIALGEIPPHLTAYELLEVITAGEDYQKVLSRFNQRQQKISSSTHRQMPMPKSSVALDYWAYMQYKHPIIT